MGRITDFDANELQDLISKLGLRKAWTSILATHLQAKPDFEYILRDAQFASAKILKHDLLQGLTIGEVSVIYEYSVTLVDSKSRKSNGQFFTPDDVAKFMAKFSKGFPDGTWLDPCSGIGNLTWHLVDSQNNPEDFLIHKMKLSDRDELALLIARTLLTVSFQASNRDLFNAIEDNFIPFDFLSVSQGNEPGLSSGEGNLYQIPEHDFVIVNPPYLATKADDRFEVAKSADLYAYFLENIVKSSMGFISVTPQSFTNAHKFRELRELLLRSYSNLTIFNFDNIPGNIFYGIKFGSKNSNTANSIRAAVTVAIPGNGERRITSLTRWRRSERDQMFESVGKTLSNVPLGADYFPKVSKRFQRLYLTVTPERTLGDFLSLNPTSYPLHVPSSPRYFISALKTPAKRVSQHSIYFRNERDRDRAYILINSSLAYWWWRVRDGGMTLSRETLKSLPFPHFKASSKLAQLLEASEIDNKVFKQNAGAAQENVKHPLALVLRLNKHVIPEFADILITTHNNSDFAKFKDM
jgi:hypothetical protein